MVVRFVPVQDSPEPAPGRDQEDLAEVIDFRSRLSAPRDSHDECDVAGGETEAAVVAALAPTELKSSSAPTRTLRRLTGIEQANVSELPQTAHVVPDEQPETDGDLAASEPSDALRCSASEDGVRILARRAKSSGEVARELARIGHPSHEIETVIAAFTESLYLDDASLARTLTERLRDSKGASRGQIRAKLRERLLDDTAIEHALGALDDDSEEELLRQAARDRARKLGGLDRATAERRLLAYLSRRGWSGQSLHAIVREALDGAAPQYGVRFE